MLNDMKEDILAKLAYGKAALKKMGKVPENFRLYEAGWLGERPEEFKEMKVVGAEFRTAKTGPNKGKLCVKIAGTSRTAHVTREEIAACEEAKVST